MAYDDFPKLFGSDFECTSSEINRTFISDGVVLMCGELGRASAWPCSGHQCALDLFLAFLAYSELIVQVKLLHRIAPI
jgi:hypothetical protein